MSIYTLTLVCAGIFAFSAFLLALLGRGISSYPGQREWIISCCLFVGSLLSITLRLYDLFLPSVLLGNACQFLAYYFLTLGTLRFLGQDFKEHWLAGLVLIFILVLMGTLATESNYLNARLAIVSFMAASFSFATAIFFSIYGQNLYRYERATQFVFFFHGLFSVLKGIFTLLDSERIGLFSKTLVSQITFSEYLLITVLWMIFLNLMGYHRLKMKTLFSNR